MTWSDTAPALRHCTTLGATLFALALAGCGSDDKDDTGTTDDHRNGGPAAQLGFYDWEPNVIGDPNRPIDGLLAAVKAAEKAKSKAPPGAAGSARYYLFGPDGRLIAGPSASCGDLLGRYGKEAGSSKPPEEKRGPVPKAGACRDELEKLESAGPEAGSQVRIVPRGITVLRAEAQPGAAKPDRYFVLRDRTELSAADVTDAKQAVDPLTHRPIVTMELTERGREAFARVTKREARRGAQKVLPGAPPSAAFQRFAIAVNDQIVSLATIDFTQNPNGIDARSGVQISGLSLAAARKLAAQLR